MSRIFPGVSESFLLLAIVSLLLALACIATSSAGGPEIAESPSLTLLEGTEWRLAAWDAQGEAAPKENTPTIVFEDGRVSGFSGCNSYFGPVTEQAQGKIQMGPLAATKKACPGEAGAIESRFLERLGKADNYSFLQANLNIGWHDEENSGSLLFKRVP